MKHIVRSDTRKSGSGKGRWTPPPASLRKAVRRRLELGSAAPTGKAGAPEASPGTVVEGSLQVSS